MASGTIPVASADGVYSRSIFTNTGATVHIAYDTAAVDAVFHVTACRTQTGYAPVTVAIFKKAGNLAPEYMETRGTGTSATVSAVAQETNGLYITFNMGYIRAIVTGNAPFTLSYS
jgi:hypothetical protein